MNFLTLEKVSKSYGEKVLFDNINLQINEGQKVALVAKNGSGKTSLLRVIAGVEASEGVNSRILIKKGARVGWLPQDPEFQVGATILEAVLNSDDPKIQAIRQHEEALLLNKTELLQQSVQRLEELKAWNIESRIKSILFKLNITQLDQKVDELSGGQKKRLALAKLMIEEPEFLILDEPTNHLDLDMIEWLEEYLQQSNLTLFMVTHDRYFLEVVCDTILELDRGTLYKYNGSYSDFLEKRNSRLENEATTLDRTKKLMKRELEWVRRMPKARGTKAKSRVDKFYDIKERAEKKLDDQEISIDIKGARLGSKIVEFHDVSKRYDDLVLVDGFTYKFQKNERIGIVGPNGVGKSTFLNLMTKQLRPDTGKVVIGGTVQFGYYTQGGIQLKDDKRVIDVITDIAEYIPLEKGQKMSAAALLERFLFSRKQQQVYVSQLSGGEKRRLYLLTVLMQNPNFLILDEPTNDLDIMTLNVLEDFLLQFPGVVVMVSHDRYFMDKLVDHLFVFEGKGKIRDFPGHYTDYREVQKREELEQRREESANKPEKEKKPKSKDNSTNLTYEQRKVLKRVERKIEQLEEKKKELSNQFNNSDLTPEQIEKLSIELGALNDELEEKEMEWIELVEMA
ncbi:MAG: ABC-F family ATP-binding cassette domain-containing protein [Bacteroidota bacterium]